MKLLIVGRAGQFARALAEAATPAERVFIGRPDFDLAAPENFAALLARHCPDVVINPAAYTAVDQAESEPEIAHQLNAVAPGVIARECAAAGAPLIHVSTDYVFAGDKQSPYVETDPTNPGSVYGATKLKDEQNVAAAGGRAVILRTAWVHSAGGKNFVRTMLRLARDRDEVRVVDDQRGSPTFADHAAIAVLAVAAKLTAEPNAEIGVFHLAGAGACTWADVARATFEEAAKRGGPTARVTPITSAEFPTPVKRPVNSVLDCGKLARAYGQSLPHWREGVAASVARIAREGWPS